MGSSFRIVWSGCGWTRWSLRFFPTWTILWIYVSSVLKGSLVLKVDDGQKGADNTLNPSSRCFQSAKLSWKLISLWSFIVASGQRLGFGRGFKEILCNCLRLIILLRTGSWNEWHYELYCYLEIRWTNWLLLSTDELCPLLWWHRWWCCGLACTYLPKTRICSSPGLHLNNW